MTGYNDPINYNAAINYNGGSTPPPIIIVPTGGAADSADSGDKWLKHQEHLDRKRKKKKAVSKARDSSHSHDAHDTNVVDINHIPDVTKMVNAAETAGVDHITDINKMVKPEELARNLSTFAGELTDIDVGQPIFASECMPALQAVLAQQENILYDKNRAVREAKRLEEEAIAMQLAEEELSIVMLLSF